jgi:outer membrane lipoprotein SlyB
MKILQRMLVVAALVLSITGAAAADTLELKDGRVLQGRFLGGTQATLRFEVNGEIQTFSVTTVLALTFTGSSHSSMARPAAPASAPAVYREPEPAARPAPAQAGSMVSVPAGTPLLVRMIDGVDSSKNHVGDIFHASLETDLVVDDLIVARKGTDVYGRLAEAKEAGHISGGSELQLELTRVVLDGRDYTVVSSDYTLQGKGRGSDTAKKVGGGAVIGAVIGAIAGGGKGAAIGAGVGSAAGAGVQVMTKGQQVRIPSETLLEFRLQQPVSLVATAASGAR